MATKGDDRSGGEAYFFIVFKVWLGDTLGVIVGACRRFVSPPPNQVPLDTTVFQLGGEAYCTVPFFENFITAFARHISNI
jgi:hypothetical protein